MPDRGFLKDTGSNPDAPAVFDGNNGEWVTHGQLVSRVTEFAARLQFPRKALGFVLPFNDCDGLVAYLASIQAGHAVATLNPELDPVLSSRLISLFQPDFIVAPRSHMPVLPEGGYHEADSPHAGQVLLRSDAPNRHAIHHDLSLLISTSGSTGSPKLVRLSWSNLENNARQIIHALRHTERDRSMVTAPIFNGYGQSVLHTMLLAGGSFALTRARLVSREFWNTVRESECNVIGGMPFFYETLDRLDLDSLNVPLLRKFTQAGGRLAGHLVRKFHANLRSRGGELYVLYGQAEATTRISTLPPELLPEASGSVGFALPGGRMWVEDDGRECAQGEEGEFIYQGPNVMMGYARGPEDLGKGDEMGGRIATGDLGYRDARGLFFITGRKSRFVKLYGWRVSLDDVEEMLAPAATVAATGEQEHLVIYAERPDATFRGVVDRLADRLNLHRSGFEIREIDAIPRLANGKIDYRSLTQAVLTASVR